MDVCWGEEYNKAGVLGVCSVLQVIIELVFWNVRAHRVLRASLWLTPCPPKVDVCWGWVYSKAGVLGVCNVLQVIVELVFCNVRARIVFYMLLCG